MPARTGPHRHIPTIDILLAVATRGRHWTAVFTGEEVTAVNEAVDRELIQGNLTDAVTLSPQGERLLADHLGRPNHQGRIDMRIDHACHDHDPCWTIQCVRCGDDVRHHVEEPDLQATVVDMIGSHHCPGPANQCRGRHGSARSKGPSTSAEPPRRGTMPTPTPTPTRSTARVPGAVPG